MPWNPTSRVRIATALHIPLDNCNLMFVDGGMVSVATTGQASIDYVEELLNQWDAADLALAEASADAGLIQADVLRWSDRAGGKLSGYQDRLNLITARIRAALGLGNSSANSSTSGAMAARRTRS